MSIECIDEHKSFGGWQRRYRHASRSCDCDMTFAVYLPPAAGSGPVPVVYWLSGLTCTDENFVNKAGAQRAAAELGLAVVAPDTSPRGPGVADDDAYDLGTGAGFYVNATRAPWAAHYRMYDYVAEELPALVAAELPVDTERAAISGHSMGGHGALVIGLRHPDRYRSISAFAPICAPASVPWGEKAFSAYLGDDREAWRQYDASVLAAAADPSAAPPIRVDQGEADGFLAEQLAPARLADACAGSGLDLDLNYRPGYDHSYFFIASFIDEHLRFHAAALG